MMAKKPKGTVYSRLEKVLLTEQWPAIYCPEHPMLTYRVGPLAEGALGVYCQVCQLLLAQRPMNDRELMAWHADRVKAIRQEEAKALLRLPPDRVKVSRVVVKCPECGLSSPGLTEHETLCKRATLIHLGDVRPTHALPTCSLKFNRRGETVVNGRVLRHLGSDGLDHD